MDLSDYANASYYDEPWYQQLLELYEGNATNSSVLSTDTGDFSPSRGWWKLLMCLFPMLTVSGNILVIMAVFRERRLRTVTNFFIISLAVADIMVGLLVMPLAIYNEIESGVWSLGRIMCDLWIACDVLACTASILNLVAISADRFLAVAKPIKYTRQKRSSRVPITIGICWICSFFIALPIMLNMNYNHEGQRDLSVCILFNEYYIILSSTGSFYLPTLLMLGLYTRIFIIIHKKSKRRLKMQNRSKKVLGLNDNSPAEAQTLAATMAQIRATALTNAPLSRRQSHIAQIKDLLLPKKKVPQSDSRQVLMMQDLYDEEEQQQKVQRRLSIAATDSAIQSSAPSVVNHVGHARPLKKPNGTCIIEDTVDEISYDEPHPYKTIESNYSLHEILDVQKFIDDELTSSITALDKAGYEEAMQTHTSCNNLCDCDCPLCREHRRTVNESTAAVATHPRYKFSSRFHSVSTCSFDSSCYSICSNVTNMTDESKDTEVSAKYVQNHAPPLSPIAETGRIARKQTASTSYDDEDADEQQNDASDEVTPIHSFNHNHIQQEGGDSGLSVTRENSVERIPNHIGSVGVSPVRSILYNSEERRSTLGTPKGDNPAFNVYFVGEAEPSRTSQRQISLSPQPPDASHLTVNATTVETSSMRSSRDGDDDETEGIDRLEKLKRKNEYSVMALMFTSIPLIKISSALRDPGQSKGVRLASNRQSLKRRNQKVASDKSSSSGSNIRVRTSIHIRRLLCFRCDRRKRQRTVNNPSQMRERKAIKILVVVLAAFLICWTPFFAANTTLAVCSLMHKDECFIPEIATVMSICVWFGYINSFLNPFIYATLNQDFRQAFKNIMGFRQERYW